MAGELVHQEADEGPVTTIAVQNGKRRCQFRNCSIFSDGDTIGR